jgi:hypothetical protein
MSSELKTEIEGALSALLAALIESREVERRARPERPDQLSATPFAWTDPARFPTRAQTCRADLASRPVTAALELAIRTLGEQAHAGGLDMVDIANSVSAQCPAHGGRCQSILNSKWHGVGHWIA